MYSVRDFELVTVAANMPDEKNTVMRVLEKMHATSRNLLFDSIDTAALQAAFDPTWESAVPYTVLVAPDGKILYLFRLGICLHLPEGRCLRRDLLACRSRDFGRPDSSDAVKGSFRSARHQRTHDAAPTGF